jgi:hypothetical protein
VKQCMMVIRTVGTDRMCFDMLVGAACVENVCCGFMGECEHYQLVAMYPGRCVL